VAFLENSWRRFERAQAHRDAFVSEWNSLIDEHSYRTELKLNPDGTWSLWSSLVRPFNTEIPIRLGEFFYQLRAALDGAVFESAILRDPTTKENSVEFILMPDPAKFIEKGWKIKPLSDDLRSFIEMIQPYNTAAMIDKGFAEINESLGILNNCARIDRHRRLPIVKGMVRVDANSVTIDPPETILWVKALPVSDLTSKSEMFRIAISGLPRDQVNLKGDLKVEVAIQDIPGGHGDNVNRVLNNIEKAVRIALKGVEELGQ
jgi:hypothetical protein